MHSQILTYKALSAGCPINRGVKGHQKCEDEADSYNIL